MAYIGFGLIMAGLVAAGVAIDRGVSLATAIAMTAAGAALMWLFREEDEEGEEEDGGGGGVRMIHGRYDHVECVCGKKARIVPCGVGVYVHCPSCDRSTCMQSDRETAEREWKRLMDSYRGAERMGRDAE